jgi:predicted acylesterase/phospholipase RssA
MAGGGPLGAIYELGVLRALEDSLEGVDLADLKVYVGVSAGAFIASGLANGLSPAQMCRIFISSDATEHPFKPDLFLQPAFREYWHRATKLPGALMKAFADVIRSPFDLSLTEPLGHLAKLIPAGIFDNRKLQNFIEDVFTVPGRTNDFKELDCRLYIVAVDLDSGVAVRFGDPDTSDVPISKAVQASSALPGLYPPVEIDGRYYLDGALRRTLHASVALEAGADLVLALNPLVPYDNRGPVDKTSNGHGSIAEAGLPVVLSQTFRAMIQSRMQIGMQKYRRQYPDADMVLVEPDRNDARMFFTNVFSYSSRHDLCEHAYQTTRCDLLAQQEDLIPILGRHGISLRMDHLQDPDRNFTTDLVETIRSHAPIADKLHKTLDRLENMVDSEAGTRS